MTTTEITPSVLQLADQLGRAMADELFEKLRHAETLVAAEYLTARQVGQMTGFSPKALEAMRSRREGPPYLKIGNSIRYRAVDVRRWVEGQI